MSNYFDAYEAVDELIDDVNDEIFEYCYDDIYEELCRRVVEGELSLEDAEILNEAAADKYLVEKGVFKTKKQKQKEEEEAKAAAKKKLKKNIAIGAGATVGAGALIGGGALAHKKGIDKKVIEKGKKLLPYSGKFEKKNVAKKIKEKDEQISNFYKKKLKDGLFS